MCRVSVFTSLSPIVSSRSSRMVLKCSSHTCRVFSRISLSSSHSAAFLSSMRSLWLDNSFSSSATSSDWSRLLSVQSTEKEYYSYHIIRFVCTLFSMSVCMFVYRQWDAPSRPCWCLCGCAWTESLRIDRGLLGGLRRAGGCWGGKSCCPEPCGLRPSSLSLCRLVHCPPAEAQFK